MVAGAQVTYRVALGVSGLKRIGFTVIRALVPLGLKTPLHADLKRIKHRLAAQANDVQG